MSKILLIYFGIAFLMLINAGCKEKRQSYQQTETKPTVRGSYQGNISAMVDLHTFDHYTRPMDKGYGFYTGPETVVTNLSLVRGAYRVRGTTPGTSQFFEVTGYTAFDFNKDLVVLQVKRKNQNYLELVEPFPGADTLYTLLRPAMELMVRKAAISGHSGNDSIGFYTLRASMETGKPVFYSDHALAGMMQMRKNDNGMLIPSVLESKWIAELLAKQHEPKPIIELSGKSDKVYPSHTTIRGYRMVTNMGNIEFRLYDQTPEYRDNFIRLVSDNFYDNLTIHRVIRGFLIQTGAADTRDATPDDVVGWKGPGYTLPMRIVSGIFHKRGAIAASKLPDARNPRDESDGSQFYIVAGRIFRDEELDNLEKQKNIKFTQEQRSIYSTTGGAPHLDNDYTVFGEVTSGMDIVDKISLVKTYQVDRPINDVRVLRIEMLRK